MNCSACGKPNSSYTLNQYIRFCSHECMIYFSDIQTVINEKINHKEDECRTMVCGDCYQYMDNHKLRYHYCAKDIVNRAREMIKEAK